MTKNEITREWVKNELSFLNTADLRSSAVLFLGLSILCLPFSALSVYGAEKLPFVPPIPQIFAVFLGALFSSPSWAMILRFCRALWERRLISRGEFEIHREALLEKDERLVGRHTEKTFTFHGFSRKTVDSTTYSMGTWGDEYYLVLFDYSIVT